MKKIALFLLAINLIIGLWLYTNLNQSKFAAEKKQQSVAGVDAILTLADIGIETSEQSAEMSTAIPGENVALVPLENTVVISPGGSVMIDKNDVPKDDRVDNRGLFDEDKDLRTNVENFKQSVGIKVKEVIGLVDDIIDDIELPVAPRGHVAAMPHCYTLGPFLLVDEAGKAAQRLQEQDVQVVSSQTERHQPGGYWVYIPSDGLRSARKQIAELQRRGIKDVSLSSQQGVRHWVSLGVYSTQERAQRRQVALANISFYTRVEQRVVKTSEHWVDIRLEPEQEQALIEGARLDSWPDMQKAFCREAGNL